jgi:hypothetical protein
MKILGGGEVSQPLFVVADAFTASARAKIEAAGGTVQVLEIPTGPLAALGLDAEAATAEDAPTQADAEPATADAEPADAEPAEADAEPADATAPADEA